MFFFARASTDDRSSAAAYERARTKISKSDDTSLVRVQAPADGRQLVFVLCGTPANARRARERIAWGGVEYTPTPEEIGGIASRFREVAEAGALNSTAGWAELAVWAWGQRGLGGRSVVLRADRAARLS